MNNSNPMGMDQMNFMNNYTNNFNNLGNSMNNNFQIPNDLIGNNQIQMNNNNFNQMNNNNMIYQNFKNQNFGNNMNSNFNSNNNMENMNSINLMNNPFNNSPNINNNNYIIQQYEEKIKELENIIAQKDMQIQMLLQNQLNINNNNIFNSVGMGQNMSQIFSIESPNEDNSYKLNLKKKKKIEYILIHLKIISETKVVNSMNEGFPKNAKAYNLINRFKLRTYGTTLSKFVVIKMEYNGKEILPESRLDELGIDNESQVELDVCEKSELNGKKELVYDNKEDEAEEEEFIEPKYMTLIFHSISGKSKVINLEENVPVGSAIIIYLYLEKLDYMISDLLKGSNDLKFLFSGYPISIHEKRGIREFFNHDRPKILVDYSSDFGG